MSQIFFKNTPYDIMPTNLIPKEDGTGYIGFIDKRWAYFNARYINLKYSYPSSTDQQALSLGGEEALYPILLRDVTNDGTTINHLFRINNAGWLSSKTGFSFSDFNISSFKHQLSFIPASSIGTGAAQYESILRFYEKDDSNNIFLRFCIDKIGRVTATASSCSWYDGHANLTAAYNMANTPDNTGYHPWLRQYNPYSNIVCTIGEYQGSIYLTTRNSATYGTSNVAGKTAYLSSNGTFYCGGNFSTSDKKKKDHIGYLKDDMQLEKFFMKLQPAKFNFKDGDGKRTHMGFYAQEVRDQAISTIGDLAAYQAAVLEDSGECGLMPTGYFDPAVPDKDLIWYMDYKELIAPTVAMVQKLVKKVEKLEKENEELKSLLNKEA